jgi:hypothetical protein
MAFIRNKDRNLQAEEAEVRDRDKLGGLGEPCHEPGQLLSN